MATQSGSEEDSSDPNQNTYYYYWSSNDDPNRQQYQWNYRRPRRSPLGVLMIGGEPRPARGANHGRLFIQITIHIHRHRRVMAPPMEINVGTSRVKIILPGTTLRWVGSEFREVSHRVG